jgi:hypothetical protein
MKISCRGWNRNHGWRDLFDAPLNDGRHARGDADVPPDGVSIETTIRPAGRTQAGYASLFFRVPISQPLNGEYMFNIKLSKVDVARLFRLSTANASQEEVLSLLNSVEGPAADDDA